MNDDGLDRLLDAIRPLLARIDATVVAPEDAAGDDVPLRWDGHLVGAIRLTSTSDGLDALIQQVELEFDSALPDLPRARKQEAVRLLEVRGAFEFRGSVERVAESLGVTRFTIYNYLNRNRSGQ
ncbi:helix-turn-helix domain-containing protein [Dactylosporangium roseum]|uniref:Helix-turn-helix domain-containing protein n=1 Tax=Dactylosporangium roseum TaxID=47989 RepID=A0ABY5YXU1_9ACTN|nr:helix-turn-helix domain-containing protein [Dactylosporangium roseum]UWZ34571.1 helix-turn-helix domain-containing protein [Dactylosporangium roseum]